jgi:hypothetical protein
MTRNFIATTIPLPRSTAAVGGLHPRGRLRPDNFAPC